MPISSEDRSDLSTQLQQWWDENTRLREVPKQKKNLWKMGELETTPSSTHAGGRNQEDHKCGHSRVEKWEEEVACCQEVAEIEGNVEVSKEGGWDTWGRGHRLKN